ncbi:MAG TPA: membrane dipeptidase [Candidatus Binataceae bacterium]|nr:membrane dipeptidase [Candidatus Binataceae bacterium]
MSEIPGCTGDCTCGAGIDIPLASSSGTCAQLPFASIDEPSTNGTPADSPPQDDPLRGYADIHVHMFANLGHGGGVVVGEAYDAQGGINQALKQDYGTNLDLVQKDGTELHNPEVSLPFCPKFLPNCGSKLFHGDHTPLDDPVGFGTEDRPGSNLGVPLFNGWPTWTTTVHQQVYYKWLERAWQGGLRLMVMQAVTNEALCLSNKHLRGIDCSVSMLPPDRLNEMDLYDDHFQLKAGETAPQLPLPPVEAQLQAAYQFEAFLDQQSGGPGQGWFRIVTTPDQARAVIRAGKLAVVLGIEVDKLFGCSLNGPCTNASVIAAVDKYYAKGVRAVFPVHNFDNGFGAAATWQDAIGVGQGAAVGSWWQTMDCGNSGYGFWLDRTVMQALYAIGFAGKIADVPFYPPGLPSCNKNGLLPLSGTLFDALKSKGMIIDIDHMSSKSIENTLSWAEQQNYPIVASHTLYFDLYHQHYSGNGGRHERMRTRAQLDRIRKLGGMVAVMLKDDVQDTDRKDEQVEVGYPSSRVPDNCLHSSKTWAQAYRYAVDVMGGPVAFGSDFNGVAGHVGPRFGDHSCGNNTNEQLLQWRDSSRLSYPFTIAGFGTFDKQVTGTKAFDFNVDGLAHIGLLPDLVADLKVIGLSDAALEPLFHSAEAYINVWEKCLNEAAEGQ